MLNKERKLINHIKNFISQLEKRNERYEKQEHDIVFNNFSAYSRCFVSLEDKTQIMIDELTDLLKWYENSLDSEKEKEK